MRNNRFIRTTFILMVSGFITKIMGMVIKVLYTRIIGEEGISLFALIMPTYSLLLTFAVLSMPFAVSKLVAENKKSNKAIMSSATLILIFVNIIILSISFGGSKFVATYLLKDARLQDLIKVASLSLPFISITSVLKGYFFGKQNMVPNAISNIVEQLIRLGLIIVILPIFIQKGLIEGVKFLLLTNVASEFSSIIIFLIFLPRKKEIKITNMTYSKEIGYDLLNISIPSVTGRIIGNIGYFLEPIILTNILLFMGFTQKQIALDYGAYNAYSISLLLMPSFFIGAISQSLLPELTRFRSDRNNSMVKRRVWQGLLFSGIVGVICSMSIFWWREDLLQLLFDTKNGCDFIKVLAPFFVLFYLEAPLTSALIAFDKVKLATKISISGILIKLMAMSILAFAGFGVWALVYAEIINIFYVVLNSFAKLKSYLI